jgi:beta-N-acetylhexosaminidase
VVVGTYSSYAGVVDGQDDVSEFINQLGRLGVPHIVVSFGNPYLISGFPDTQAYMLAWSGSEASQRAAARALFGGFPIAGQAPTSIPPLFEIGHGMSIPMRVQTNSAR